MKWLLPFGVLALLMFADLPSAEAQRYRASTGRYSHPTMNARAVRGGQRAAIKTRAIQRKRVQPRARAAARIRARMERSRATQGRLIKASGKFRSRRVPVPVLVPEP